MPLLLQLLHSPPEFCLQPLSSPTTRVSHPISLLVIKSRLTTTPIAALGITSGAVSPVLETSILDFWRWVVEKGAKAPAVKPAIVNGDMGLGLLAARDISRNESIVEVPRDLWITGDMVAASEIGSLCGGLEPWVSITLFLLREKGLGDASSWRPYLDILPSATHSTIFCCTKDQQGLSSEKELLEIQGTQLLRMTLGVKEYVKDEFLKAKDEIICFNHHLFPSTITLDDFLWGFGILRSRAFYRLPGESLKLIPLADLINHNGDIMIEDSSWKIKGKGLFSREVFSLCSPTSVKDGDQVFTQYDLGKSNAGLALDYGFTERIPSRDIYTLSLEIPESDPFYGDKLDILQSIGLSVTVHFDIVFGNPLPPAMLPFLRLAALGGADAFLLESIFRNSVWGFLELPISRNNEEMVCSGIRSACQTALSAYHTTIEEDLSLLESVELDRRTETAVVVRVGEKRVLRQMDEIFGKRELELDGLEYYQERRLRGLGLVPEHEEIIFWETK